MTTKSLVFFRFFNVHHVWLGSVGAIIKSVGFQPTGQKKIIPGESFEVDTPNIVRFTVVE